MYNRFGVNWIEITISTIYTHPDLQKIFQAVRSVDKYNSQGPRVPDSRHPQWLLTGIISKLLVLANKMVHLVYASTNFKVFYGYVICTWPWTLAKIPDSEHWSKYLALDTGKITWPWTLANVPCPGHW